MSSLISQELWKLAYSGGPMVDDPSSMPSMMEGSSTEGALGTHFTLEGDYGKSEAKNDPTRWLKSSMGSAKAEDV